MQTPLSQLNSPASQEDVKVGVVHNLSSDESPQSFTPSHTKAAGMHVPLLQEN
jgi:hypothetical protein